MRLNDTGRYGYRVMRVRSASNAALVAALAAATALSGCASVPDTPAPQVMRDPATLEAAQAFAAPQGAFPDDRWWTVWGDPALDALVAEALAASPDLAVATARARQAQALVGQARAATLPTIGLEATAGGTRPSQNQGFPIDIIPGELRDQGRIGLSFAFDPDLWGRNRAALAAATSAAEAATVDLAQARLMLASTLVSTYAELNRAFAVRDRALAVQANAEGELALAEARVASGLDNASTLHRAREELARAQGTVAASDAAIALLRNALATLVGAGPDRGLAIARPTLGDARVLALPDELPLGLVARRPDIVSARLRAESAAARVGVARADFYPQVNLSAVLGLQAVGLDVLFRQSSLTTNFGPVLSLPIFEGGALAARYQGAGAAYDEAVAHYNATLLAAVQQVADAVATKRGIASELAAARLAEDEARASFALIRQRVEAGLADRRALLAADRQVILASQNLSAIVSRDRQADIALAVALGGGFHLQADQTR